MDVQAESLRAIAALIEGNDGLKQTLLELGGGQLMRRIRCDLLRSVLKPRNPTAGQFASTNIHRCRSGRRAD